MKCSTFISQLFLLLYCLCYTVSTCGQTSVVTGYTTFQVCNIPINDRVLPQTPQLYAIEQKILEPEWCYDWMQEQDSSLVLPPKRQIEAYNIDRDSLLISHFHPFLEAVHLSYAQHRPLIISPDMIWLLICQGFAQHRAQNIEAFATDFEKEEVVRTDIYINLSEFNKDWEMVLPKFSEAISEQSNYKMYNLMLAEFTTTGRVEKMAFELTLMDVMSKRFVFSMNTFCGIPKITLEGTPDDWLQLEKRTQMLSKYKLQWWGKDLKYILRQFTKASQQKVNKHFWKNMYKFNAVGSGNPYITGWINRLFPYVGSRKTLRKNPVIGRNPADFVQKAIKKAEDGSTIEFNRYFGPKITTKDFPSGLSKVDFTWQKTELEALSMELIAGFVGISQDRKTQGIRPEIGWVIVELEEEEDESWEVNLQKH